MSLTPTVPDLDVCLRDLTDWQQFGHHLPGIQPSYITVIEKDKHGDSKNQKLALYQQWLSVCPAASWKDVINALEIIREMTIAKSVRDKHTITPSQQNKPVDHTSYPMSPPSSVPDPDPQEDCTIPEDVLTELDTLETSFIDLTENIESETAAGVENGKVTVKSLVSRVQKEKAFQIKEIESVTSTRDFFQAILPFYTFLNCHLIIRIALFLSGPIAEEANDYDSKIIRFRKSTKVKFLQRILKRCHHTFRPETSRKVVIAAEGLWGMQSIFLIEELIKMLFPMRYPDELQWFKVVSGSVIMTFIISERMILPFIEKSKKKLEFMRLMGIISLKIGDEFVIKSQENKMFSFENSLIEATMADDIEAVEFLLQYIQVDVNIKNTDRSLLNSLNHEYIPFKETDVEEFLAHHHMYTL